MLDPILTRKELEIRDIKAEDNLSCNYHEMVEFCILREGKKEKSGIISPDFSRGDSDLFRDLKNHMADGYREKGPGKLNCQGCPPSTLRPVCAKHHENDQMW